MNMHRRREGYGGRIRLEMFDMRRNICREGRYQTPEEKLKSVGHQEEVEASEEIEEGKGQRSGQLNERLAE